MAERYASWASPTSPRGAVDSAEVDAVATEADAAAERQGSPLRQPRSESAPRQRRRRARQRHRPGGAERPSRTRRQRRRRRRWLRRRRGQIQGPKPRWARGRWWWVPSLRSRWRRSRGKAEEQKPEPKPRSRPRRARSRLGHGTTVGPEAAIEAVIAGTTDGENVREAERVGIERLPRDPDEDSPSERGALFPGAVRLRDSRARSSMNTRVAFVTKNERYRVASVRSPHP